MTEIISGCRHAIKNTFFRFKIIWNMAYLYKYISTKLSMPLASRLDLSASYRSTKYVVLRSFPPSKVCIENTANVANERLSCVRNR